MPDYALAYSLMDFFFIAFMRTLLFLLVIHGVHSYTRLSLNKSWRIQLYFCIFMELISQKQIIIKRTFVPDRYVKNKSIVFGSYNSAL